MRLVFILGVLLLASAFTQAQVCVSHNDCPLPDCMGSARFCKDNMCSYSPCLVPAEASLSPREGAPLPGEAFKDYEDGINLSIRTRNPGPVRNTLLASLGLGGILMLLLKGLGVLGIVLVCALLFMLATSRGFLKILVFLLFGGALAAGIAFYALNMDAKGWEGARISDFSDASFRQLGSRQMDYLHGAVVDAGEFRIAGEGGELVLTVIENAGKDGLGQVRLGSLAGTVETISGEEVLHRPDSLVFDEDRFIFIVSGETQAAQELAGGVAAAYPLPAEKSRIFGADILPPKIRIVSPDIGAVTSERALRFRVEDAGSGVGEGIHVRGIPGSLECSGPGKSRSCVFMVSGRSGPYSYDIRASDIAGNTAEAHGSMTLDTQGPYLAFSSPGNMEWTRENSVRLIFADDLSQISGIAVRGQKINLSGCEAQGKKTDCTLRGLLSYGENRLDILFWDSAQNMAESILQISFDNTAPEVSVKNTYTLEIAEDYLDYVLINGKAAHNCDTGEGIAICHADGPIQTYMAGDYAGNTAKKD